MMTRSRPTSLSVLHAEMRRRSSKGKAEILQRFFKTGPGEYGEGDVFLGIPVPVIRQMSKKYKALSFKNLEKLVQSKFHEERLLALLILVLQSRGATEGERKKIYDFYLRHMGCVNNWDLVDLSAEHLIGAHLMKRDKSILYQWAASKSLWKKRIAMMSTFHFVKNHRFSETLKLAKVLLGDEEDLIHKAVGWMLREIGKRNQEVEERFLNSHYQRMPRTMLRYAIERFPEKRRLAYLRGTI